MKIYGLKQALNNNQFDVAFGGARSDEEKFRAKEQIFSFRNCRYYREPRVQRPALRRLRNTNKIWVRAFEYFHYQTILDWTFGNIDIFIKVV